MKPLNGEKTHPLTKHGLWQLGEIAKKPIPRQKANPGSANRLLREGLVDQVMLPSPFYIHAGDKIAHLKITEAGIARLKLETA